MSEGWLFRLRTSLGSQQAAPTWPVEPLAGVDPTAAHAPTLRDAAPPAMPRNGGAEDEER